MKKNRFIIFLFLCSYYNYGQQTPTGTALGTFPATPSNTSNAWLRGGNLPVGSGGTNNEFGTFWNSPIHTYTNGIQRSRLNGTTNYNVNGYTGNRDGFFLLGQNANTSIGSLYGTANAGAFTLFHLNGTNATTGNAQEFGYRPWMRTGITFTENDDRAYIGYRTVTGEANDLVVNWSDNAVAGTTGPDNMVFNFTAADAAGVGFGNAFDLAGTDLDGREVLRLTGFGNVGIGPRFNNAFQPTSTTHQHQENAASSWFQITNQFTGGGAAVNNAPTAITAADGVRFGIVGSVNPLQNGIAMLYNQETRPLLFSTNANTNAASPIATLERFRIASVGTPTILYSTLTYGTYNPAALTNLNLTRASLSHDPVSPIYRPMSLFHLGYGAAVFASGTLSDGWRRWMDIGTYTSSRFDHMYVGLKQSSATPVATSYDAVIGFGRNLDSLPNFGPDHLRFIFTTNYNAATPVDDNNANDIEGLELGRFYPNKDTLGKYGRFGIGDFTASGLNQEPTHKLDVDGNGRFRLLPDSIYMADASITKVVFVDSLGVLRWKDANLNTGIGSYCADPENALTGDYEIPFNDNNIYYTGHGIQGATPPTNAMALGYACGDLLPAKFNVWQQDSANVLVNTIAASFVNNDRCSSFVSSKTFIAVNARSEQLHPSNCFNMGGNFTASRASFNYAVKGTAKSGTTSANSYGGHFESITAGGGSNFGVYAEASSAPVNNYGIYAKAPTTNDTLGPNYAGYFNGDVVRTGADNFTSDFNLKENIDTITNAMEILNQLVPKTFTYKLADYPSMSLPSGLQYGLIAQDVETILPALVNNHIHPAVYDSTGTEIYPAINFKGLEYTQLIPLLIKGVKEQQQTIASLEAQNQIQDSINNALNDRLTALENCIASLGLCSGSSSSIMPTSTEGTKQSTDVTLKDVPSIVLSQNVPNPFAERTTIAYELTSGVQRAQILFYNADGKLINSVELGTNSGKGELNVFADDLSNGIYTYTLVVDGKIIGTKRMVKNK